MKRIDIRDGDRDNEIEKFWVAEITGLDEKFGFARKFVQRKEVVDTSSNHQYFKLFFDAEEGKYYQVCYQNVWNKNKNREGFRRMLNGKYEAVTREEIITHFKQKENGENGVQKP